MRAFQQIYTHLAGHVLDQHIGSVVDVAGCHVAVGAWAKRADVISTTVKPSSSRIFFSAALRDRSGTSFMPASPGRRGFRYRSFKPTRTTLRHPQLLNMPARS